MPNINYKTLLDNVQKESDRIPTIDLIEYSSFEEKSSIFTDQLCFESTTRFLNFIDNQLPGILGSKRAVFRGLGEAKYRLFNTAQRAYNENSDSKKSDSDYHCTIEELISNARAANRGVLPKFLQSSGLNNGDISILAFLQHYGAPTPFLDWTTDLYTSIYFALSRFDDSDLKRFKDNHGREINDFFSIYILIEDQALDKVPSFKKINATNRSMVDYPYQSLKKKKIAFISDSLGKKGKPMLRLVNNLHIANQNGLFIYNNSCNLPLEEVFFSEWKMLYAYNIAQGLKINRIPIVCLNIHKSIGYDLKKRLKGMGISHETMYSDPKVIVQNSIPSIFK